MSRLVAAALTLLSAVPAWGQMIPQSVELEPLGGYYFFGGNLENLGGGPMVGGRLGLNILEYIGAEATVAYVPTYTVHGNRKVSYLQPHLDLVVHVTPWRVVPYFAVGGGFQYTEIHSGYRGGDAPSGDTLIRDPYLTDDEVADGNLRYKVKDFDFLFDVGGGLKFLLFERGGIRLDGRYVLSLGPGGSDGVPQWVCTSPPANTWNGCAADARDVEVNDMFHHAEATGSFFFLLGGKVNKDKDGDGVPDRKDDCPEAAEDIDGFEDVDGCPDSDNDRDGVDDVRDGCKDEAEDRDGFRDEDGCPDPDNDGDGLLDEEDGCPQQAEDLDGHQDADGCPDPDNDEDGIVDVRDACPLEPEDIDGFRDDDGCPEPDNDGDGISDRNDKCPNAAEEVNGIEDGDGCPEADADQDGVYDGADRCPGAAEDLDGFQDDDGCPDPDNDGDGLPDMSDFCPMNAEDADGWQDGDGCPDADNDDDGIMDERDLCPTKAEDDDGFEDTDGCPDFDNDQDGVQDGKDSCPNAPEVINGFEDGDGCPDELPEALKRFTGAIPDINFKAASDELLSTSFPTLNQAADVLAQFAGVRLEIEGHASADGDDAYNLELSQKRAESVMRYLISRGVDAGRLTAVGYGELRPVDTNRTEEGRRANRRVEFRIKQD